MLRKWGGARRREEKGKGKRRVWKKGEGGTDLDDVLYVSQYPIEHADQLPQRKLKFREVRRRCGDI